MTVAGVVERRVNALWKQQRQRAGSAQGDTDSFRLSPTCPPSTSIAFRGGLAWWPAYSFWPAGFYIPSYTVDLSTVSVRINYSGYTYTFTNANWYAPCIFTISQSLWPPPEDTWPTTIPDDSIYLYGGVGSPYLEEFETAGEAEIALREIIGDRASFSGIAAGGLILRNNGNTADENQYMPVDQINRGRSYLFGSKRYGWEMG